MEELLYLLTKNFVACVPVHFFFHSCSVLPCWPQAFLMFLTVAMKFLCFSSNKTCLHCFKSLALALTFVCLWCRRTVTRVYSHMITKISQMDGLPNFRAPLMCTKWRTCGLSKCCCAYRGSDSDVLITSGDVWVVQVTPAPWKSSLNVVS